MNFAAPPPETEQSSTTALLLSAAVHLLLLGALFFGVQWKSKAPSSIEVEVWRAPPPPMPIEKPEPQITPKPEPKPTPKAEIPQPAKPDIALKDDKKKKKEEPKKPEPKKEEPKKPEPKKVEPKREEPDWKKEIAREQKQREQQQAAQDQIARAAAEADHRAQLKAEQAAFSLKQGQDKYGAAIGNKIRGLITLPQNIQGNPEAVFAIKQLPSGEVLDVKLRKSSGNRLLDEAIERAIYKASPLPRPDRPELFQRDLELKYKPFLE